MDWSAVMFLSDSHSDGTHSLTAEHPLMQRHISPNLMKKQEHFHSCMNYSFNIHYKMINLQGVSDWFLHVFSLSREMYAPFICSLSDLLSSPGKLLIITVKTANIEAKAHLE